QREQSGFGEGDPAAAVDIALILPLLGKGQYLALKHFAYPQARLVLFRLSVLSAHLCQPQRFGGDPGAFRERAKLRPQDRRVHSGTERGLRESAVRARVDAIGSDEARV